MIFKAYATFQSFFFPSWVVDEKNDMDQRQPFIHETRAEPSFISISFALDQ